MQIGRKIMVSYVAHAQCGWWGVSVGMRGSGTVPYRYAVATITLI